MSRTLRRIAPALLLFALAPRCARAQKDSSGLHNAEVEKLRDTAMDPYSRVEVFMGFLNDRTNDIQGRFAKQRRPGREQDVHDLLEQFSSIATELEDNLDDYGKTHPDLRKVLPKLLIAIERWGSIIKSPPDDPAYNISRRLALDSVSDLRDDTNQLIADQKKWFTDHPPSKDKNGKADQIEIR